MKRYTLTYVNIRHVLFNLYVTYTSINLVQKKIIRRIRFKLPSESVRTTAIIADYYSSIAWSDKPSQESKEIARINRTIHARGFVLNGRASRARLGTRGIGWQIISFFCCNVNCRFLEIRSYLAPERYVLPVNILLFAIHYSSRGAYQFVSYVYARVGTCVSHSEWRL